LLSPAYDFSKLKNLESIKDYSNSHLFEIATGGLRTKKHSIKVRYIDFNGKFGYTGLGRFFFVDDSMYIITNDKQYESEHNPAILYILIKKYPTFQSKSIPLTNLNGTTSFITNDKYVYKTGDYN